MELLQRLEDRGYPVEYLLSRIRGRRSRLITDWRPLIYDAAPLDYIASARYQGFARERSPEGLWRNLVREHRWVYSQMNGRLRTIFQPYFFYAELRTIFICFREMIDQQSGKTGELLEASLLSDEIKRILSASADLPAALAGMERVLSSLSAGFAGLAGAYEDEGLRGVEQRMTNAYLSAVAGSGLHPLMKTFFARLIDSRNIMSLYKCLRLDLKTPPSFISGGLIAEARLREVLAKNELFGVNALISDHFGIKIDAPEPTKVELALYKGLTGFLKKEGREPFGIGLILDYLWRCSLEVMNLSVLFHGKDLERELVAAELVR